MIDRSHAEAWWDEQHRAQEREWLTDSRTKDVLDTFCGFHDMRADIERSPFLEIGVGTGRFLLSRNPPRYGIDISPEARSRLGPETAGMFSPYDEPRPLGVKVTLCTNVVIHCDDDMVMCLLGWAHAAMVAGGRLYLQSTSVGDVRQVNPEVQLKGGAIRPALWYVAALDAAGFDVVGPRSHGFRNGQGVPVQIDCFMGVRR